MRIERDDVKKLSEHLVVTTSLWGRTGKFDWCKKNYAVITLLFS
jgi:hypothetical protein